jgi:hypothetical protein
MLGTMQVCSGGKHYFTAAPNFRKQENPGCVFAIDLLGSSTMTNTRRAEIISIEQRTATKPKKEAAEKKDEILPAAAKRYDLPCLYQG